MDYMTALNRGRRCHLTLWKKMLPLISKVATKNLNYMTALDSMKRCHERFNDIFKKTSPLNHKLTTILKLLHGSIKGRINVS